MNLRMRLEICDPDSAASLREVYGEIRECPDLEFELACLCAEQDIETTASWLLKRHIERGCRPNLELSRQLLQVFLDLRGWQARLHFLQFFQHLAVPPELKHHLRDFVLELTSDRNKFVRAWSFSALHRLAISYPEFRVETLRLIQRAMESEAPSVKARLRNLPAL
ncbi:MAG: hypothetical protein OXN84_07530 [Albidovulum sp.]|nr:hypothetical protein [Albidovulum sp.]